MKRKSVPVKGMNPALAAMTQQRRDNLLIRSSHKANLILAMMVLHDKYGFGKKRLMRFLEGYRNQLEAYNEGYVESVEDFEKVLWDECGIKIEL